MGSFIAYQINTINNISFHLSMVRSRGWVIWGRFVFWVLGNTFVLDISDISTIGIIDGISNDLSTAIGKIYTVFTIGSITITVLIGSKVSSRVVISNSIAVLVNSWSIISWFWMIRSWFVISWGWVNNWFMDNWGYIWGWLVYNWGMVGSWLVINWSWVVDGGWVVWCCVVRGMVSINWSMGRGVNCSTVLFLSIWIVYVLWCSMGLARNNGMISSMGLMDGMAYRWSIAMFDNLVAALVGYSNSQKSGKGNKYLKWK